MTPNQKSSALLGDGLRADYSPINQAWIVRSYNPEWSTEVQHKAPVLRLIGTREEASQLVEKAGFSTR